MTIKITDESREAAAKALAAQLHPHYGPVLLVNPFELLDLVLETAVVRVDRITAEDQAQVADVLAQFIEVAAGARAKAEPIFGEEIASMMGFQAYQALLARVAASGGSQ